MNAMSVLSAGASATAVPFAVKGKWIVVVERFTIAAGVNATFSTPTRLAAMIRAFALRLRHYRSGKASKGEKGETHDC